LKVRFLSCKLGQLEDPDGLLHLEGPRKSNRDGLGAKEALFGWKKLTVVDHLKNKNC